MPSILIVFLTAMLFASPAVAVDGVMEISQTCALETGCFSGDTPGFPVTITGAAGRSYRLTSDLRMAGSDTVGVLITADNVSLDLGGFMISCTIFVPPATVEPCGESLGGGLGDGYAIEASGTTGVEVRNGVIFGMRWIGVTAGRSCLVRNLRVLENGAAGIVAGPGCNVSGNVCADNGSHGLSVAGGYAVNNVAENNGGYGILGSIYRGNVLRGNTLGGAQSGANSGGNYCEGLNVTSPSCP